jgi:hypothetical protein
MESRMADSPSPLPKFVAEHWPGVKARASRLSAVPWVVKFSAICVVVIIAFVMIFRHDLGLDAIDYDVGPIGGFAIFGLVGVIGLSVALMAATSIAAAAAWTTR